MVGCFQSDDLWLLLRRASLYDQLTVAAVAIAVVGTLVNPCLRSFQGRNCLPECYCSRAKGILFQQNERFTSTPERCLCFQINDKELVLRQRCNDRRSASKLSHQTLCPNRKPHLQVELALQCIAK
jgi:hypothetical protein